MQKKLFTNKDTWSGGFYELAMEISADDMNQIKDILQAILTFPPFTGYYLDMNVEPEEQIRQDVNAIKIDPDILPHFLGILTLPNGKKSACGVCLITEDQERCWVDFYLPMGALAEVYNVGAYPFGDFETSPKWQEPVDDWLYKIGFHIN